MTQADVAMLVVSCDKYKCWWAIFFDRLDKYWPSCGLKVYLLSNADRYERDGVINIRTGEDLDWSSNLLFALDRIQEDSVLLMLEDAPLATSVDAEAFTDHLQTFARLEMDYLNLKASPKPVGSAEDGYGTYPSALLYRAALVPCLWKKEVLKSILICGESAWQFEIRGSARSSQFTRFYALQKPFFRILHCVIEGRINRSAYRVLKSTGEIRQVNFKQMAIPHALSLAAKVAASKLGNMLLGKHKAKIRTFYFTHVSPRPEWI